MTSSSSIGPKVVLGKRRQWGNLLLNALFVGLLVLGVLSWRYVIPAIDRAIESLVGGIATVAAYGSVVANGAMDEAYALVVADPIAQDVLGEPITFARMEDVEWLPSHDEELVFAIPATGAKASGRIHCRVHFTSDGPTITRLELEDERYVRRLFAWQQLPGWNGGAQPD